MIDLGGDLENGRLLHDHLPGLSLDRNWAFFPKSPLILSFKFDLAQVGQSFCEAVG